MTTTYNLFINQSDSLVTTDTSVEGYVYISSRETDNWYEAYFWLITVPQHRVSFKSLVPKSDYLKEHGNNITLLNHKEPTERKDG